MGTPREFIAGFPCHMSASLMNKIIQKNPQLDLFVYMDDSSMNFQDGSQIPAGPTKWKKSHGCSSFTLTHTQYEELEALFSYNMFPDKIPQRELALKLNRLESTVKICFKNLWVKMMKQQQQQKQQSLKPANQVLPAAPTASASSHSFLPGVSDSCNSLSCQPSDPFH